MNSIPVNSVINSIRFFLIPIVVAPYLGRAHWCRARCAVLLNAILCAHNLMRATRIQFNCCKFNSINSFQCVSTRFVLIYIYIYVHHIYIYGRYMICIHIYIYMDSFSYIYVYIYIYIYIWNLHVYPKQYFFVNSEIQTIGRWA